MAQVKCQQCALKDDKELMVKDTHPKGYIHFTCIPGYVLLREQKAIENQQWCDLYEYLKVLHGAIDIPVFNIKRLKELKTSKNITYKLMLDAYKIAEETISWFIKNVLHDGNTAKDMDACITMMIKHGLNKAYQHEQLKIKNDEEQKKVMQQVTETDMSASMETISVVKKKDDMDISALI